ncbi:MAG: hypothetical protein SAJ37_19980 [Oscillatoria sp. PMC 1068.18]|nr:hypothetical protein [Oscillatoria sp. PMC 1076.18]MEC4991019.1 hypothetical protein [Oscillatoria sp. PMC 1068.18]
MSIYPHQKKQVKIGLVAVYLVTGAALPILNCLAVNAQFTSNSVTKIPVPPEPTLVQPNSTTTVKVNTNVPQGTKIMVNKKEAEKIVVATDETVALTVKIEKTVVSPWGTTLLPAGSEIIGEITPVNRGSQFIAKEIIINGESSPIEAYSGIITNTQRIRRGANAGTIIKGALLGGGAAAALAALTGDGAIATEEVLAGSGVGAVASWLIAKRWVDVVVIDPQQDLNLTLAKDLSVSVIPGI